MSSRKILFNIDTLNKTDETIALETIKYFEDFFTSLNLPINISQLVGKTLTDEELTYLTSMCTDNNTKPSVIFTIKLSRRLCYFKLANH